MYFKIVTLVQNEPTLNLLNDLLHPWLIGFYFPDLYVCQFYFKIFVHKEWLVNSNNILLPNNSFLDCNDNLVQVL